MNLTVMIQNCVHTSHKILLYVVKGDTLGCTVINTPFDVYTVIGIPIIFWILRRSVSKMVARLNVVRK